LTALVNEAAILSPHLGTLPSEPRLVGEMLVSDIGRLRHLVEELLEVSRLDTATPTPEPSPVDIEAFLAAVVTDRHPEATVTVAGNRPVTVDRVGLERVVANLLDNARTHAPGASVSIAADLTGDVLTITVADDGPGVADAALPLLFDRFFMADAARRGGTGLGLAIAAQHAARMGAELTARHAEGGRGITFELRMSVTGSLPGGDDGETSSPDAGGISNPDTTGVSP
ncbi:MAG: HAMP domain-containing histidine kinase, partial [Actinomycetota bacterium]|nr:HAMP domain-containing histidine kinase [Actinomycetota bacterium]